MWYFLYRTVVTLFKSESWVKLWNDMDENIIVGHLESCFFYKKELSLFRTVLSNIFQKQVRPGVDHQGTIFSFQNRHYFFIWNCFRKADFDREILVRCKRGVIKIVLKIWHLGCLTRGLDQIWLLRMW